MARYYFDTSIWLDFFENRNEPNLPKGRWARQLLSKIMQNDDWVLYSDNNIVELRVIGYASYEIKRLFQPIKPVLIFVASTKKQVGKAKDLAYKRNIPRRDALHALIARDNKAVLVTLDKHFRKLRDITQSKRPQDII